MKVLVTGASGRLGLMVASALERSHETVLIVRNAEFSAPNATVYRTGIEDTAALQKIFQVERPDIVIHLASVVGAACEEDEKLAVRINVGATRTLAELAKKHNVKQFIFSSTAAVYHQEELVPTSEESNISPRSVYGVTKLEAEQVLNELAVDSQTKFTIFRIFNLYGPKFNQSLVNRLIASNEDETIQLQGFKRFFRDYIHVDEVVELMTNFKKMSELGSYSLFNIASGRALSNADLIKVLGEKGFELRFKIVGDYESYSWADITRARQRLGFNPSTVLKLDGWQG